MILFVRDRLRRRGIFSRVLRGQKKERNEDMKKSLKCILSVILTAAMLLTVMLPAFAAGSKAAGNKVRLSFEKVENGPDALHAGKAVKNGLSQALPVGNVRVSIVLDEKSTLESGFSSKSVASNRQAMSYRQNLLQQQNALADKISKEILGGNKLNVKWNLTLAANIISAEVPSVAIDRIANLSGVKKVVVERQYSPAVASVGDTVDPNMATSTEMTGAAQSWANGYTGLGSTVAIIDTGIDTDHQSFDAEAFEFAVEQSDKEAALIDEDYVDDLIGYTNAGYLYGFTGSDAYISSKIPYAINYVDGDLDVTHDNDSQGEHGSHVAGIAAANRFIATENGFESALLLDDVLTQGAAPDAQILVMKVFGKGGGAYDSDYFAAIEDAIILGADAVNLSLGSANPGYATDETYQELLDALPDFGTVVSISAGNAGMWADESYYGVLWDSDVSFDTVGSPGSFSNALTVASVDNDGATGPYFVAHGYGMDYPMFYTETTGDGKNEPFTTLAGDREFVYIDSPGYAEDFEAVADVLEGKIAICNRGDITFVEKCTNAAANGAIGVIIANNQSGTISMALKDYNYEAPAVSITQEDAYYLANLFSDKVTDDDGNVLYYTGTITVGDKPMVNDTHPDYHTMSSFSSYGVPGDLSLKPEITAPGGNIYSVNGLVPGGQAYENMSGTSMAAPQITGLTALLAQYIRENDLEEKTGLSARQLAQSLLMSTAEPMIDRYGVFYPVFQQGAGLANADAAMNAKSYILMDEMWDYAADGKVKAELGDDPDRIGEYEVGFSLNNFSDEDVEYDLYGYFFTQYVEDYYDPLLYYDGTADFINADVSFTVDGEAFDAEGALIYDFNDDGVSSVADVRFLLDYIVGNEEELFANAENADYDGDDDVDTYDAYQILKAIGGVTVTVPAGGSVNIVANIVLDPDSIGDYDNNGNYVEGYIFADELSTADGAYGVEHSIPVIGYYGSWTEPSMTDLGSVLEYDFGMIDRYPYVVEDEDAPSVQGFLVRYAGETDTYYLSGNPAVYDDEYLPERNSFNANDMLSSVKTTLIRNAAASRFFVTDADGNVIHEQIGGRVESAFYYANQGAWYYTSNEIKTKYTPEDLQEGDEITFNLSYAPEYYVNEDGSVDWDALGDGATMSYTAVIDNTAPELSDVVIDGYDPETGLWDTLTFTATDNRYIAAIAVFNDLGEVLDVIPADLTVTEEGVPMEASFDYDYLYDNSWFGTDRLLIQVYDYASNITNYKLNFDLEDLTSDVTVYLPEEAGVILNSTTKLDAEVYPWGVDETLVWTSSDESIATVDENGVVTGVAEGMCVITATTAAPPYAKADCLVTVKKIEKTLNGVVWDEQGKQWFSEIETAKIPAYTKLTEDSIGATITGVSYGPDGYLFASDDQGEIYIVDEDTLTLVADLGNLGMELNDIAAARYLGDGMLVAAYGTYILMIDLRTGAIDGFDYADDIVGDTIVGVAAAESVWNTNYDAGVDVYFFVDNEGCLYEDAYIVIEDNDELPDGTYDFGAELMTDFGYTTDSYHYNSLYFDGDTIFWARFNNETADLICEYDIFDLDLIANLGAFDEDVWPAAALFQLGVNPIEFNIEEDAAKASPFAFAEVKAAAAPMKNASAIAMPVKGSLNAALPFDGGDPSDSGIDADGFTQTVELTVDKEATNGKITVQYDPSKFELAGVRSAAAFYSFNDDAESGVVTFAYVTREDAPFAEGETVATLIFVTAGTDDGDYTVTTEEINDEHPEDASTDVSGTNDHVFGDPEWIWTATDDGYKVSYSIKCLAHDGCEEDVLLEADVQKLESEEATCTEGVGVRWIATVEYDGETLTDERTEYTEDPLGHDITEVEAEDPTCTETGNIACYYCTRCEVYFSDEEGTQPLENDQVVIPATGHDIEFVEAYIPCVKDGIAEHYECANCGMLFSDEEGNNEIDEDALVIAATGHDWDEWELIKDPTCTAGGVRMRVCRNNPNHKQTEYVPAYGHGTMEYTEAIEPTCTEDGMYDFYTCPICGVSYYDEEAGYPVEDPDDLVIPALGHSMTLVEAADPTCTEPGNVEYYACANCEKNFADEDGEEEIEDVVIPAAGHTMVKTEAKAATCENDGNVEFYTCSVCGDNFADAEGKTPLTNDEIVIEATGHAWDDGTVITPATCTGKGLMMYACENDPSHVKYLALSAAGHVLVKTDAKAATCTEDGNKEYYTCSVCGGVYADDQAIAELKDTVIPATGHTLVKTDAKAATCTEAGNKEYYTCSVCEKIFADAEGKTPLTDTVIPALGHQIEKVDAKEATVDAEGNIEHYRCAHCGSLYEDAEGAKALQPEDVVIPKLAYKLGDINRDGQITSEDARLALRASVGLETYEPGSVELLAGDVNFDGQITADDARSILRAAVDLEDPATWVKPAEPEQPAV